MSTLTYPQRKEAISKGVLFLLCVLNILVWGLWVASIFVAEHRVESEQEEVQTEQDAGIHVAFLDVGQGDATFITFGDGQQMLVDCGIDTRVIEQLGEVMPFYDRSLDYLVVTHPDADHYGGCIDVLKRFDIGHIVYTGYQKPKSQFWHVFDQTLAEYRAAGGGYTEVTHRQQWEIASTTIDFLYPTQEISTFRFADGDAPSSNDTSIIMKLTHGTQEMLLMADAEEPLELYLSDVYGDLLDVEVLKAGHHGSGSSSITPFLEHVTPDVAIISSGKDNPYGHPSGRVLKRFERFGTDVYRTDQDGTVHVFMTADDVVIQ